MVYRVFVSKKADLDNESKVLMDDIISFLNIGSLTYLKIYNRYDVENISAELFDYSVKTVFSEPQVDETFSELNINDGFIFAVEALPGQFDQRADSAAQCIQIISQGDKPIVRYAKLYVLKGNLSNEQISLIKNYVINPVETREASLELPETLITKYDIPTEVETIDGFTSFSEDELKSFVSSKALAMDLDDIAFCQEYFRKEGRQPTITEIRMIDTYWSDHCRHTTFLTHIDEIRFEDELIQKSYEDFLDKKSKLNRDGKPVTLMEIATIAARYLSFTGRLENLDKSDEINACTVKFEAEINGKKEPWLLLFKNETHNHPTEIEPFGGAATCIGGAIRDPLSGRSYVYGAMRLTGASDPTVQIGDTIPGKLPQRKIVTSAAAGYSSYGNQIGLATGIVDEIYHPGYAAKHMELGFVIAATPAENVRREVPCNGDMILLLGGNTGRDGIGGATGSSKSHNAHSVETCGAEVQKGNAPEERKLQRLFRNEKVSKMIKRCNDFGAGGVSVAIGELADGLEIDLNAVPKKYEGLDGTELAISESQERMAVVVEKEKVEEFIREAQKENVNACVVAKVTDTNRLIMKWNGKNIVDISRDFLNSNGAPKHSKALVHPSIIPEKKVAGSFSDLFINTISDLNVCSKRGLSERFDSTIGAGSVLMPFGGKYQLTPVQAMVQKISSEKGNTNTCSLAAWGYNPYISESSPYHGAYLAVVESVSKLIASGAEFKDVYLTFQEYFEKLGHDELKWGKPLAALLGAYQAQMDFGIGSIGGKDSMSGSFEKIHVPPTLISFAVTIQNTDDIVTPEYKKAGTRVYLFKPKYNEYGLPDSKDQIQLFEKVNRLIRNKKALSCYTPGIGGIIESIFKQSIGNGFGFDFNTDVDLSELAAQYYGSFIVESSEELDGILLGTVTDNQIFRYGLETVSRDSALGKYENVLENVYSCNIKQKGKEITNVDYHNRSSCYPKIKCVQPKVLIPVFPGTNCEYDSAKIFEQAGAKARIFVINNQSSIQLKESVKEFSREIDSSQIVFIPGGFSGGDEPDGSGKFITAFFRNDSIRKNIMSLLNSRDGLICGICNGFQALIKLGLVPYGEIIDADENCPTLTFNSIMRHQSKIVRTRISSVLSPWLKNVSVGDIINVPISHGEGRFICNESTLQTLIKNGQIATQYVDLENRPTYNVAYNPNNSVFAIEGITSPDGRVFGKMGHSERISSGLYKNVPGNYDIGMFKAAVEFFN